MCFTRLFSYASTNEGHHDGPNWKMVYSLIFTKYKPTIIEKEREWRERENGEREWREWEGEREIVFPYQAPLRRVA